jgi:hypothetical protein
MSSTFYTIMGTASPCDGKCTDENLDQSGFQSLTNNGTLVGTDCPGGEASFEDRNIWYNNIGCAHCITGSKQVCYKDVQKSYVNVKLVCNAGCDDGWDEIGTFQPTGLFQSSCHASSQQGGAIFMSKNDGSGKLLSAGCPSGTTCNGPTKICALPSPPPIQPLSPCTGFWCPDPPGPNPTPGPDIGGLSRTTWILIGLACAGILILIFILILVLYLRSKR